MIYKFNQYDIYIHNNGKQKNIYIFFPIILFRN